MDLKIPPPSPPPDLGLYTLGVVSFLNALPLHASLASREGLTLRADVPSALAEMLAAGACDVALLPIVDYWRRRDALQGVSDACIASNGETLTVRVFSKRPADRISRLHVDGDSHTSVILAQLIWRELYGRTLELIPWNPGDAARLDDVQALLLIGDKVVTATPPGFGFEVDLGAAWKYVAGLPFVFAAWYGPKDRDLSDLAVILAEARDAGEAGTRRIAQEHAARHGWPEQLAVHYLCETLRFRLTDEMRASMERFFDLAVKHRLL